MIKNLREPVYLLGQVEFRVLKGSLSVNGRIFTESERDQHILTAVYSPKSTALLAFESQSEGVYVEFRALENGLEGIQGCQPTFANLFAPDLEFAECFEEGVPGAFFMRPGVSEEVYPLLKINEEWKSVMESVLREKEAVVFVCGHRKVGKSSFCRYLLNGLLNDNDKVDFIDLDPGQTEFTPAGFLARQSFHREDAMLGPPFTHLQVPDDAIYLASSNGSEMPLLYCRAIQSIAQSIKSSTGPVIVNTMGWMTGLGLEFVQFALQTFKPSHVLAFMAPESEDLIRKCLTTSSGLNRATSVALSGEEADRVHVRYMGNPVCEGPRGKHSPADQRNLAYWAYFFGSISCARGMISSYNFNRQLSDIKPVVVPLSHVQLACTSREIDLFDLVKTRDMRLLESWLLMRVVGLAFDNQFDAKSIKRWVNLLPNRKIGRIAEMRSVGVGIVRSIVRVSEDRIHLHIITPVPLQILSKANTLILGSQQLPLPMISGDVRSLQAEAAGFSTQMVGTDVNGSSARKTRHNMRRR